MDTELRTEDWQTVVELIEAHVGEAEVVALCFLGFERARIRDAEDTAIRAHKLQRALRGLRVCVIRNEDCARSGFDEVVMSACARNLGGNL